MAFGGVVGGLFIALAAPFGGGNGGSLGDAHQFERQAAVQVGGALAALDFAQLHVSSPKAHRESVMTACESRFSPLPVLTCRTHAARRFSITRLLDSS